MSDETSNQYFSEIRFHFAIMEFQSFGYFFGGFGVSCQCFAYTSRTVGATEKSDTPLES